MDVNLPRSDCSFNLDDLFRKAIKWLNFSYLVSLQINNHETQLSSYFTEISRDITNQLCNDELRSDSEFDLICSNIQRCSMILKQALQNKYIGETEYKMGCDILSEVLSPVLKIRFSRN